MIIFIYAQMSLCLMISKTIMILAIAAAFVVGSIATNSLAYAQQGGQGNNLIVDALNGIADAISGIEPTVTVDQPIIVNAPAGPQGEQGIQGIPGLPGAQGEMGVQGESFTQIIVVDIASAPGINREVICTSDSNFLLHFFLIVTDGGDWRIQNEFQLGGPDEGDRVDSFVIGGNAGDEIAIVATENNVFGKITLQTSDSAEASCEYIRD